MRYQSVNSSQVEREERYSGSNGLMKDYNVKMSTDHDEAKKIMAMTPYRPSESGKGRQHDFSSPPASRTIDEFYDEAHLCSVQSRHVDYSFSEYVLTSGRRLSYIMLFVSLGLANVGDAAEIGSMGYLLAHDGFRQDIVGEKDGTIASSLYLGMLVGGVLTGPLCDRNGRRVVLLGGLALNSSFGVAAALATMTWQLILCRLFMGLGIGAIVSCLLALTSEHTPPKSRGAYLNFVSAFWTFGSLWVAGLALLLFGKLDRSWRLYVLANAVPSSVSFVLVLLFVPESARFLALHGKLQEATKVANTVAKSMGYVGDPLRLEEVRVQFPTEAKTLDDKDPKTFSPNVLSSVILGFLPLFAGAPVRRRIMVVQSLWFFVSFGSGVCLWMARVFSELPFVHHVYLMTLFFALASIPGVLVAGFVLDRVGRTKLLTWSIVTTALSLATFALLTMYSGHSWAVVLSACFFHSCLVLAWSALSVVTAEVFPTKTRSTAMGLSAASGRFASILVHTVSAPLVNHETPAVLLLIGTGCFLAGAAVTVFFPLENMTGEPLEDTMESSVEEKVEGGEESMTRV